MRRTKTALLSLGLALGAGGALTLSPIGSATSAPPQAVIAVVDVLRLCESSPAKSAIDAKRKANKEAMDTWMKAQKAKLDEMDRDFTISPELEKRAKKIAYEREKMTTEFDYKARVAADMKSWAESLGALYDQVRGAVSAIAAQKGYTLVLYKTPTGEALHLDEGSQSEFILNVAMRPVLYASPEMDITEEVLAFMQSQRPPTPPAVAPNVPPAMGR